MPNFYSFATSFMKWIAKSTTFFTNFLFPLSMKFSVLWFWREKDIFHDTDFWYRFVLLSSRGPITLKQFNILNGGECQFFILMLHLSWNGLQKTWHSSKSFFSLNLWKFHCFDFGREKKNIFHDSVLLTYRFVLLSLRGPWPWNNLTFWI